jgi:hypothetical protein
MLAALFAFGVSLLLIAGSTQIENPWLSAMQFIAGAWFAIAGAITGWQSARKE